MKIKYCEAFYLNMFVVKYKLHVYICGYFAEGNVLVTKNGQSKMQIITVQTNEYSFKKLYCD